MASQIQYQAPGYDTNGNVLVKTQTEFCTNADSLPVMLANGQMVYLHERVYPIHVHIEGQSLHIETWVVNNQSMRTAMLIGKPTMHSFGFNLISLSGSFMWPTPGGKEAETFHPLHVLKKVRFGDAVEINACIADCRMLMARLPTKVQLKRK